MKIRFGGVEGFFLALKVGCLILFVLFVGFIVVFNIGIGYPSAEYTTTPLSLSEFYSRSHQSGGLPTTATNLFCAYSNVGFTGFVEIHRFDSPTTECIKHAETLLHRIRPSKATKLTPLTTSPQSVRHCLDNMGLKEVTWFDIETIHSGFEGHLEAADATPAVTVWVDSERGRFYYFSSD